MVDRTGGLLVASSAFCTAIANLLMRRGVLNSGRFSISLGGIRVLAKEPVFLAGVFLYGVAAIIWFRVLSTEDLTVSYPMLVGLSFVAVTIGSILWFQEHVSAVRVAGMVVILLGVGVVARG